MRISFDTSLILILIYEKYLISTLVSSQKRVKWTKYINPYVCCVRLEEYSLYYTYLVIYLL